MVPTHNKGDETEPPLDAALLVLADADAGAESDVTPKVVVKIAISENVDRINMLRRAFIATPSFVIARISVESAMKPIRL